MKYVFPVSQSFISPVISSWIDSSEPLDNNSPTISHALLSEISNLYGIVETLVKKPFCEFLTMNLSIFCSMDKEGSLLLNFLNDFLSDNIFFNIF